MPLIYLRVPSDVFLMLPSPLATSENDHPNHKHGMARGSQETAPGAGCNLWLLLALAGMQLSIAGFLFPFIPACMASRTSAVTMRIAFHTGAGP